MLLSFSDRPGHEPRHFTPGAPASQLRHGAAVASLAQQPLEGPVLLEPIQPAGPIQNFRAKQRIDIRNGPGPAVTGALAIIQNDK